MNKAAMLEDEDIVSNTIIQGNVDLSKYQQDAYTAQRFYVKPALGKELYDKLVSDYGDNGSGLEGLYLELYEEYVKYLIIYSAGELYLKHAAYQVTNAGVIKARSESFESVDKLEIDFLMESCRGLYNMYKADMFDWLKENPLPEYKNVPVINSKTHTFGGWYLNTKLRRK